MDKIERSKLIKIMGIIIGTWTVIICNKYVKYLDEPIEVFYASIIQIIQVSFYLIIPIIMFLIFIALFRLGDRPEELTEIEPSKIKSDHWLDDE